MTKYRFALKFENDLVTPHGWAITKETFDEESITRLARQWKSTEFTWVTDSRVIECTEEFEKKLKVRLAFDKLRQKQTEGLTLSAWYPLGDDLL